jgi:cytochrome c
MKSINPGSAIVSLAASACAALLAPSAWALDSNAAEQVVKDNKCFKCHDVARKKDGPAYRDVAAKLRVEPDAVAKVIHHMTAGAKVKFADGHEESHKKLKTSDQDALQNVAQWILSLEGGTRY